MQVTAGDPKARYFDYYYLIRATTSVRIEANLALLQDRDRCATTNALFLGERKVDAGVPSSKLVNVSRHAFVADSIAFGLVMRIRKVN